LAFMMRPVKIDQLLQPVRPVCISPDSFVAHTIRCFYV
jgi:hypothetical protein